MYPSYEDITSRIAEEPTWWICGVPRYGEFHPSKAGVYDKVAVLLEVGTEDGAVFHVAMVGGDFEDFAARARKGDFRVGDPPNHRTCVPYHQALEFGVLEFWHRDDRDWRRVPDLELPLMDHDYRP